MNDGPASIREHANMYDIFNIWELYRNVATQLRHQIRKPPLSELDVVVWWLCVQNILV